MKVLQLATAEQAFPAATVAGNFVAQAFNAGGTRVFQLTSPTPQFPWDEALPLGTYRIVSWRMNANGDRISDEVEGSVLWDSSVQIAVPSGAASIVDL